MRLRKGLVETPLNAVIGLVLVSTIISVSFFVYSSFVDSLTKSQVTKGFESFIKPIQDVCQGVTQGISGDIMLPISGEYTYGIFQTRLNPTAGGYQYNMPLAMKKCEGGYCMCLFRLKKDIDYDFWNSTDFCTLDSSSIGCTLSLGRGLTTMVSGLLGIDETLNDVPTSKVPIWHFNTAGARALPSIIERMVEFWLIRTISDIIIKRLVPKIVGKIGCDAICSGASAGIGTTVCIAACTVALYTLVTAIARASQEALLAYFEEATEPLLLTNYPLNFMSVSDPKYIDWTNDAGGDTFNYGLLTPAIDSKDIGAIWKAAGQGFVTGALEGAINGILAIPGAHGGGEGGGQGWKAVLKGALKKAPAAISRALSIGTLKTLQFTARMKLRQMVGIASLEFDIPLNLRPTAYVRSLLNKRVQLNIDKFSIMALNLDDLFNPGTPKPPEFMEGIDSRISDFDGFDIINCVKISELGPNCNDNTKIRMDYDHDMIFSYRLTDPINNPAKAIFCGYNSEKKEVYVNLVDVGRDAVLDELNKQDWGAITAIAKVAISGIAGFVNMVVGDWLLAGAQTVKGLFMECVQPHYIPEYKSEYFQYWIPYLDTTGLLGTSGAINIMTAKLVPEDAVPSTCQAPIIQAWKTCSLNYYTWRSLNPLATVEDILTGVGNDLSQLNPETLENLFNGVYSAVTEPGKYLGGLSASGTDDARYNLLKTDSESLCPNDGTSPNCLPKCISCPCTDGSSSSTCCTTNQVFPCTLNATCIDIYHPEYLNCLPGIHVNFYGVIQ